MKRRPLHRHACIEIMYVLHGSVTNHVENQVFTYEAGECCIMNKNIRHSEDFSGDFQAVFLMFRDDFIAELLNEYYETASVPAIPEDANLILQFFQDSQNQSFQFDKIYLDCFPVIPAEEILEKTYPLFNAILHEMIDLQPGSLFYIKGAFSRLLHLMTDPDLFSTSRIHSESNNQEYLVSKITHIMKSSHGRCTRDDLSSQLHYNGEYLNRIIKKYTGKTILEYGQSIYLDEARMLLANTDKSISSIIDELGFSNRSHFYRLFERAYGQTPLDYRKQCRTAGVFL
ncbi:MAG: AraC family transcriptional regulator [Eubacterium sp.]|nr:AraC family transcriptional regulator [Eubacterium sp.]